jgi:uncharacterized protein YijF (DUF1287 family)
MVTRLDHNQTVTVLQSGRTWTRIETRPGATGYVRSPEISALWIKAHKKERRLYLMRDAAVVAQFSIALSPGNPLKDKIRQGDAATPEGRYYVAEMDRSPQPASRYGARSLRLSYPNIKDARRGLQRSLISYPAYLSLVRAVRRGKTPNQQTRLGGSIRIHGGGSQSDWTAGCLALDDKDAVKLFDTVMVGTRVEIYRSAEQERLLSQRDYLARLVLQGAREQLARPALYSKLAMSAPRLTYPMGDIPPEDAVCTDIIIRALRRAGLDLQPLVHEDAMIHPARYRPWIKSRSFHIDHRRTRNLQIFFSHHAQVLPNVVPSDKANLYRPGNIVTMDTGIRNGTIYDHVGIAEEQMGSGGFPLVINIWTVGQRTSAMPLLGHTYPSIVGHFRLGHPFDYQ